MKKVLVSDNLGQIGIDMFTQADGITVDVKTGLTTEELKATIGDYDALVIRSATKVTDDILTAARRLKVIGRAGIGLDNVDIPAATKRGIIVMNTPGGNVITTAEHAIAMMLSLSRNIPAGTATMKAGQWEKKKLQGREIFNKVLGVVGFGKIGSIVADRARGLRMQVVIYDPYVAPEQIQKAGFDPVTLDELFAKADYITIHVPKLKDTMGFINRDAFAKMRDGVMLINCARGGIVDEAALFEAITSGKVAGAALDVFATEPPPKDHPLLSLERVICTPHLGASTAEAQANVAIDIAKQIIDFLQTGTIMNAVNVPSVTGELLSKLRPYLVLAEKLGSLQAQLNKGALTEVIIEYRGDFQGLDLNPVTTATVRALLAPEVKDDVNFINAVIIAKERGIKVTETSYSDSEEYLMMITVKVVTTEMSTTVAGTLFGKNDPRIVRINTFRLEMVPKGHLALIYNLDRPGSIGEIGTTLGIHRINIGKMQVGQDKEGERNIIFLCTDTPIPDAVYEELRRLKSVRTVIPLEF